MPRAQDTKGLPDKLTNIGCGAVVDLISQGFGSDLTGLAHHHLDKCGVLVGSPRVVVDDGPNEAPKQYVSRHTPFGC
jgi:hypothetical protein